MSQRQSMPSTQGQAAAPGPVHDHYMRPRRSTTTPAALTPTAPPMTSGSTSGSQQPSQSQYTTRSTTGSLSPVKLERESEGVTNQSTSEEGEDEVENAGDEDSKLEIRRARNRLKQRNLRLRRANYIKDLEDQVQALEREATSSQTTISTLTANEAKLRSWVSDLESALFRQGQSGEVEGLRRVWGRAIVQVPIGKGTSSKDGAGGKRSKGKQAATSMSSSTAASEGDVDFTGMREHAPDPLSTLVQAAMVTEQSLLPPGAYNHHLQSKYSSSSSSSSHVNPNPNPHVHPPPPGARHHQPAPMNYDSSSRRPFTSHTPVYHPSAFTSADQFPMVYTSPHAQMKRKRSVSGPIHPPTTLPNLLPSLHSLSEPGTASQPFQSSFESMTLPPILSLPMGSSTATSSPARHASREAVTLPPPSSLSSPQALPPIRPLPAPTTPPPAPGSHSGLHTPSFAASRSTSPGQSMKIGDLIAPDDRISQGTLESGHHSGIREHEGAVGAIGKQSPADDDVAQESRAM